ncbi:MAG: hypothetical protein WCT77_12585, partial [Bacteroidota bacterium]
MVIVEAHPAVNIGRDAWFKEYRGSGIHAAVPDGYTPRPFTSLVDTVTVQAGRSTLLQRSFNIPRDLFSSQSIHHEIPITISPLDNQAKLPWWVPVVYGSIIGVPMVAGSIDLYKGVKNNDPRRRIRGISELTLGTALACGGGAAVTQQAEVAPVPAIVEISAAEQRASVIDVLKPWENIVINGHTVESLEGSGFSGYVADPLLEPITTTGVPLEGSYTIAGVNALDSNQQSQRELFLVTLDPKGIANGAYHIQFPDIQPEEAAGLSTNAELIDSSGSKKADIYINADLTSQTAAFATINFVEPTPVPNGAPVSYVELHFPVGSTQEQKQNFIDELMTRTLTGEVLAAGEEDIVVVSPTAEVPVSTPTNASPIEGDTFTENGYTYTRTIVRDAEGKEIMSFDARLVGKVPFLDERNNYRTASGEIKQVPDIVNSYLFFAKDVLGETVVKSLS